MEKLAALTAIILCGTVFLTSCSKTSQNNEHTTGQKSEIISSETADAKTNENKEVNNMKVKISVNGTDFEAEFFENGTAKELIEMLPMTMDMKELNGNEKYFYLPKELTAQSEAVGNINEGDIMLFGDDCLVIFYESFSTTYSYTRIGKVKNVDRLKDALGSGNVSVELKNK